MFKLPEVTLLKGEIEAVTGRNNAVCLSPKIVLIDGLSGREAKSPLM